VSRKVLRTIYVDDDTWLALGEEAAVIDVSRSAYIRQILADRGTYEPVEEDEDENDG